MLLPGELRWQELSNIANGAPPFVIAKGPAVQFVGGAVLSFWAEDVPGYTTLHGRGLFTHGR